MIEFKDYPRGDRVLVNTDLVQCCVPDGYHQTKIYFRQDHYMLVKGSFEQVQEKITGKSGVAVTRRGGQKRIYVGFEERTR